MGLSVMAYDGECVDVRGRRLNGKVALDDLRARCLLLPRKQWEDVLVEALQALALARESRADLADLAVAGPLLRTRVQSEGSVLADDGVHARLCDGLVEVLQVEREGALSPVPARVAEGWGVPVDELLVRGRAQVLQAEQPTVEPVDLGAEGVVAVQTTGPWAASQLHRLGELVGETDAGSLVALPTRHLLLAAPLRTRPGALDAAQALLLNAERLWQDGPGGLSPDLYWVRAGQVVHLPGTPTSLSPPVSFLTVLDALPLVPSV
jgi:hypothetical protein